jgi:hypothetical protein
MFREHSGLGLCLFVDIGDFVGLEGKDVEGLLILVLRIRGWWHL